MGRLLVVSVLLISVFYADVSMCAFFWKQFSKGWFWTGLDRICLACLLSPFDQSSSAHQMLLYYQKLLLVMCQCQSQKGFHLFRSSLFPRFDWGGLLLATLLAAHFYVPLLAPSLTWLLMSQARVNHSSATARWSAVAISGTPTPQSGYLCDVTMNRLVSF